MDDILKRPGILKISNELIEKEPQVVAEILKNISRISTRDDFIHDSIIYRGYSKDFDLVKEGENIPQYDAVPIKIKDDDLIKYNFIRVDTKCIT